MDREAGLIAKALASAVLVILIGAAAVVFEAASKTAYAGSMIVEARDARSNSLREMFLDQAEQALTRSWARPTAWHAGAMEELSGVYLYQAELRSDSMLYGRSVRFAVRSIELAPVQPNAWTRLALLAERGRPNPLCDVRSCLERSWAAGPMLSDYDTACVRLQLAYRHGLLANNDPRLLSYVASGVGARRAAACLSFLPPAQLFHLLLAHDR